MDKNYYLNIARQKSRMIFGVDLVLSEKNNKEKILNDGAKLGKVIIETTERFGMPLALPFMDLDVEKDELLKIAGITTAADRSSHPGAAELNENLLRKVKESEDQVLSGRLKANCEAIKYVGGNSAYLPVGMCIGPFSFMTKILTDPITPALLASMGITADEDRSVRNLYTALEIGTEVIIKSVKLQIDAGAKAICICEPAANSVYISPDTLSEESEDIFDELIIKNNRKIKDVLDEKGVDLILHDCGELTDIMLKKLCRLNPVILSLGSARNLWEDAQIVPREIVLMGNLPTKRFFLDKEISGDEVKILTKELIKKMEKTGHPFILGSECDVLSVEGYEKTIMDKINLMINCECGKN